MRSVENISGKVFNRLTAIRLSRRAGRKTYWIWQCSCGTEKEIRQDQVLSGATKSCGCLAVEESTRRAREGEKRRAANKPPSRLPKPQRQKLGYLTPEEHEAHVLRAYGLLPGEYADMLDKQGGVCAVCAGPPDGTRLVVDHCHTENRVRGLLCNNCNRGLGMFKDSVKNLALAIGYLSKSIQMPT